MVGAASYASHRQRQRLREQVHACDIYMYTCDLYVCVMYMYMRGWVGVGARMGVGVWLYGRGCRDALFFKYRKYLISKSSGNININKSR